MFTLDDFSLLQLFVSGDVNLEANANFRVEPLGQLRQLLTTRGMLLATANAQALPPYIQLRAGTKYADTLHQTLLDYDFVPVDLANRNKVIRYEHHPVPAGFSHTCDVARHLWRKWWKRPDRFRNYQSNNTGFMILQSGKWHAIQEIVLSRSILYITTADGESILQGDDQAIWLEQNEPVEATVFSSAHNLVRQPSQKTSDDNFQSSSLPVKNGRPDHRANPVCPALASVVKYSKGKYYIRTAIGNVVVSGGRLCCSVCSQPCKRSSSNVSSLLEKSTIKLLR
ncbi:MAG: hypothetical protein AAF892_04855 [Cyanobacteria bacterium P01_D01_bin.71]